MLRVCENAFPNETGGLLIGHYTESLDCAIVITVTGPPDDSKAGRTWFARGVKGLKAMLARSWKTGAYYVGEWHAHPGGTAIPSGTDRSQMKNIARKKDFECEEPILILVGGSPPAYQLRAMVFRSGDRRAIELYQIGAPASDKAKA
jgi:integrative and conjugative element protein (TIGR02256 family)